MKKIKLLISPILAIILEILPYGAVLVFAPSPTERIRQTFSYFNLMPVGYANVAPFITAILTCVILLLALISIKRKWLCWGVFLVSLIATIFSLLPLMLGLNYYTIVGGFITITLAVECVLALSSCFSNQSYENNTYEINEQFSDLLINTNTENIVFKLSDDEKCKLVCYEDKNMKHSVFVANNALTVNVVDTRKWYDHILSFKAPKTTIYLPMTEYSSLTIKESTGNIDILKAFKFNSIDITAGSGNIKCCASATETIKISSNTGDVCVENASSSALDLSVSTGKVTISDMTCNGDVKVGVSTGKAYLTNVSCKNLISSGSTGDISLANVIATKNLNIKRSTGNVNFNSCDATEVLVVTNTGDVKGSFCSDKIIFAQSKTGDIDIPKLKSGGKCEITTGTGDVKIAILQH